MKKIWNRYFDLIIYLGFMTPFFIQGIEDVVNKGWLYTDIGSYAIFITVIFAYLSLIDNKYSGRGIVFIQIIKHKEDYYFEISNVGILPTYDIHVIVNKEFILTLDEPSKQSFNHLINKKFSLKKDDGRYLLIGRDVDKDKPIFVTGTYKTKGGLFYIKEKFSINDFELGFTNISVNQDNKQNTV